MKQFGFAVNEIKLQRAIATAKGDESLVYDLYVQMGGKVQKGYEKVEAPVVEAIEPEVTEPEVIESEEPVVETKKRGRPSKNA